MEQIPKIHLSNQADDALDEMLTLTNKDFTSGRVRKTQLLSWIILDFYASRFAASLKKIRADHFDKIAHLRSVIREMEAAKKQGKQLHMEPLLSPLKAKLVPPIKKTQAKPDEN